MPQRRVTAKRDCAAPAADYGGGGIERHCPQVEASDAMIINLNQYRKKRRRAEAETRAKENRVRFGRSKEERAAEARERERAKTEIENKRLD
jgi:uncharacterized protein DUF4169